MKAMNSFYVCNEKFCKCTEIIFGGIEYNENNNESKIDLSHMKDECYCCVYDIFDGAKILNNTLQKTKCSLCLSNVEKTRNENDEKLEIEKNKLKEEEFVEKEKLLNERIKLLEEERYFSVVADNLRFQKEQSDNFKKVFDDENLKEKKRQIDMRIWQESGGGWSDK
jgi:hypothetical protein